MSNPKKTVKRAGKSLKKAGRSAEDSVRKVGRKADEAAKSAGRHAKEFIEDPVGYQKKGIKKRIGQIMDVFTPDVPEPEEQTIIPIPDERTAETQARKRRAKKGGSGRSSTILTEGLGG